MATSPQLEAIYGQPNEASTVKIANRVGGEEYDKAWPERARQSLW